jgi:hypothetical protein
MRSRVDRRLGTFHPIASGIADVPESVGTTARPRGRHGAGLPARPAAPGRRGACSVRIRDGFRVSPGGTRCAAIGSWRGMAGRGTAPRMRADQAAVAAVHVIEGRTAPASRSRRTTSAARWSSSAISRSRSAYQRSARAIASSSSARHCLKSGSRSRSSCQSPRRWRPRLSRRRSARSGLPRRTCLVGAADVMRYEHRLPGRVREPCRPRCRSRVCRDDITMGCTRWRAS